MQNANKHNNETNHYTDEAILDSNIAILVTILEMQSYVLLRTSGQMHEPNMAGRNAIALSHFLERNR